MGAGGCAAHLGRANKGVEQRALWWHPEPNNCTLYPAGALCPHQLLVSLTSKPFGTYCSSGNAECPGLGAGGMWVSVTPQRCVGWEDEHGLALSGALALCSGSPRCPGICAGRHRRKRHSQRHHQRCRDRPPGDHVQRWRLLAPVGPGDVQNHSICPRVSEPRHEELTAARVTSQSGAVPSPLPAADAGVGGALALWSGQRQQCDATLMSKTAHLVLGYNPNLLLFGDGEGVDNLVSLGEILLQAAVCRNDLITSTTAKTFGLKQPDVLSCQSAM